MPEEFGNLKVYDVTEFLAMDFTPKQVVRFDAENQTFDFDAGNGFEACYWNYAADFDTPLGLIHSVEHLCEKTWFTTEHAHQLMGLLATYHQNK